MFCTLMIINKTLLLEQIIKHQQYAVKEMTIRELTLLFFRINEGRLPV